MLRSWRLPRLRARAQTHGVSAVRHDFAASLVRTLWFQVGVFALAFLMMLAWPRGVGRKVAAPSDAGLAAGRRSEDVAAGPRSDDVAAGQAALSAPGAGPGGSAAVAAGPGVSAAASNGQVT